MIPYIVCFSLALYLFKFSEKVKDNQRLFVDFIAISILCVLAALRDESVGTDTSVYLEPVYKAALNNGFYEYLNTGFKTGLGGWHTSYPSEYEFLFTSTIYLVTKITGSFFWCKFVIEILIIAPIYYVLRKRKNMSVCLGMFVFLMLLYNPSLNLMRQGIAISISLMCYQLWIENKRKIAIIAMIVGFLFHASALMVLPICLSYTWLSLQSKRNTFSQERKVLILIVLGLGCLFALDSILPIFVAFGFKNYLGYVTGKIVLMFNQIIARLPGLILIIICNKALWKEKIISKEEALFFEVVAIYEIIFAQFAGVNQFGNRIAMYFTVFNILSYSYVAKIMKYKKNIKFFIVTYLIFYWWYYVVYLGVNQTVPYMFA